MDSEVLGVGSDSENPGATVPFDPDTTPLNFVERLAASLPIFIVAVAIATPLLVWHTDRGSYKLQGLGMFPALCFSFLMLHFAALMGFRFKVLWVGNYVIGVAMNVVCIGLWLYLIGSCIVHR
jgi:hypothetical protein